MKQVLNVGAVLMLGVMLWYGYSTCLTADGFIVQGYVGAVIPSVFCGWFWLLGRVS